MLIPYNKIEQITVRNFKNLDLSAGLSLNNLNIFIGPNGSGKSNVISLFQLLQNSLMPSSSRHLSSFRQALAQLGGSKILNATLPTPDTIDFAYKFRFIDTLSDEINYQFSVLASKEDNLPIITREILSGKYDVHSTAVFDYYKLHEQANGEGFIYALSESEKNISVMHKLTDVPANDLGVNTIPILLEKTPYPSSEIAFFYMRRPFLETVANWRFYNTNYLNLNEIRKGEPEIGPEDIFVNSTCDNLAIVLDNLIQADFSFQEKLNTIMRDVFPEMVGLRTKRLGRLRLTIEWQFKNSKRPFYLDEMSDGSVRMLCWALILLSPQLPSLIVLDEPEIGLHVSWLKILAEWIKSASQRTQVIVCTHSPDLLDQFTDHLEDIFVFNSQDKTTFTAEKLKIKQLQTWLDEGWELGDLYRVGDPAVGGWPI